MSNVKVGDLAIVVKAYVKENLGKICTVVSASNIDNPDFQWFVEFPYAIDWGGNASTRYSTTGYAGDDCLRPVSGLPMEEIIDEEAPVDVN